MHGVHCVHKLVVCYRMLANPGIRPTAEVVGILVASARRSQVVGILKQEVPGDVLALTPCDPRMPKMMVPVDSLPAQLKGKLLVSNLSQVY